MSKQAEKGFFMRMYSLVLAVPVFLSFVGCSEVSTPTTYNVTYYSNFAISGVVPVDDEKYLWGDTVIVKENTDSPEKRRRESVGLSSEFRRPLPFGRPFSITHNNNTI
jgi:hypothetical protein